MPLTELLFWRAILRLCCKMARRKNRISGAYGPEPRFPGAFQTVSEYSIAMFVPVRKRHNLERAIIRPRCKA